MNNIVKVLLGAVAFFGAYAYGFYLGAYTELNTSINRDGMFVCTQGAVNTRLWRTTDGFYLGNNQWKLFNPINKNYVLFVQSPFESCAMLPLIPHQEQQGRARSSSNHSQAIMYGAYWLNRNTRSIGNNRMDT